MNSHFIYTCLRWFVGLTKKNLLINPINQHCKLFFVRHIKLELLTRRG